MLLQDLLVLFVLTVSLLGSVGAQSMVCPSVRTTSGWLDLFPLPCTKHAECRLMGTQHLCCRGFCTKGIKGQAAIRSVSQPSTNSVVELSSSSTSTSTSTTSSTTSSTTTTTTTPSTTSSTTTTTTTTTTTPKPTTTTTVAAEPLLPFLQLLPVQNTKPTSVKSKSSSKSGAGKPKKWTCPKQAPVVLFPIPCEKTSQCQASLAADQVCCGKRCVKGVPAPVEPPKPHQPLLGVIPRECPSAPLGELLFEVQSCKSDADCWPRVCCPDGARSYCRTAKARLDLVPVANQIDAPVRMLEQYLQCTAPPQYDLFPQKCTSSVDCFPNLCCAEGGKKHCRPPQRSFLALLAGVGQRFGSTLNSLRQFQANNNQL